MGELITTKELSGLKVVDGRKGKRIGKAHRFVFHPSERRCIGILVKRPDAALMFHRKDLFVSLGGFDVVSGQVVVYDDPEATGHDAVRALGVDWDACVIWVGMPVVSESGDALGYVDTVAFDRSTGKVESLSTEDGAANKAILGRRVVPGALVRGFKRGAGGAGGTSGAGGAGGGQGEEGPDSAPGAILVSDKALELPAEGGVAAAAGKATAVVAGKAKKGAAKAKPAARKAAEATGKAVEAGAYAAGRQLGRASGMFAAFKEEYDKAAHGGNGDGKGSDGKGGDGGVANGGGGR